MPPSLERVLVLTLSAVEAVGENRWSEVSDLMRERDRAIAQLESDAKAPLDPNLRKKLRSADLRLGQAFADARAATLDAIARQYNARRIPATYAKPQAAVNFDRIG
ncbi:MAG: hypothetical protein M9921_02570 [Fimbriimonadaceae bacterium]|nr:hypothetical protein [Chthonomonadaceae bacterium]MCO5295716.1 hypothetical protein [Fimbriimonadaceae bacterium]